MIEFPALISAKISLDKADEDVYSELQASGFQSHLFVPGRIIALSYIQFLANASCALVF